MNHRTVVRLSRKIIHLHSLVQMLSLSSIGPCDVTKKEDLENLVSEISKKEKYINVLICNAGISGPKAEPESEKATELKETLFKGESFQEWSDTYNTNVSAVYVSLSESGFPRRQNAYITSSRR